MAIILPFFDNLLTYFNVDIFTPKVNKDRQFLTSYPPHLVYVVFEQPYISNAQLVSNGDGRFVCGHTIRKC